MKETVLYTEPTSSEHASLYVIDKTEKIVEYPVKPYTTIGRSYEGSRADVM